MMGTAASPGQLQRGKTKSMRGTTTRTPSTPQGLIRGLSSTPSSHRGASPDFSLRYEVCVGAGASLGVVFSQCSSGEGAFVSRLEARGAGLGVCAVGDRLISVDGIILTNAAHEQIKQVLRRRHAFRRVVKFERLPANVGDLRAPPSGMRDISETYNRITSAVESFDKKTDGRKPLSASNTPLMHRSAHELWRPAQKTSSTTLAHVSSPLRRSPSRPVTVPSSEGAMDVIRSLRHDLEAARAALHDERLSCESLRRSLRALSEENEALVAKDAHAAKVEVELDVARSEIERSERVRQRAERKLADAQTELKASNHACEQAEMMVETLRGMLSDSRSEVDSLLAHRDRAETAEVQIMSLQRRLEDSHRQQERDRNDYRSSLTSLQDEVEVLRKERVELQGRILGLESEAQDVASLADIVVQKRGYCEQIVARMKSAEVEVEELRASLERAQEEVLSQRVVQSEAERRIEDIDGSAEAAIQELQCEMLSLTKERDSVIDRLTRCSQEKMELFAAHESTLRELAALKDCMVEEARSPVRSIPDLTWPKSLAAAVAASDNEVEPVTPSPNAGSATTLELS